MQREPGLHNKKKQYRLSNSELFAEENLNSMKQEEEKR
jgi:hypothetical protein